jgi:hypothetical protein
METAKIDERIERINREGFVTDSEYIDMVSFISATVGEGYEDLSQYRPLREPCIAWVLETGLVVVFGPAGFLNGRSERKANEGDSKLQVKIEIESEAPRDQRWNRDIIYRLIGYCTIRDIECKILNCGI